MKNKGIGFIVTGLLLIAAAVALVLYNLAEDARASQTADAIMGDLIPEVIEASDDGKTPLVIPLSPEGEPIVPEMPIRIIDGKAYIAVVSIPALDLELPVFSSWDYSKLNLAPCRFSGSAYTNDMVICAHNYSGHFGQLKNLSIGDDVMVLDMDGNVFDYRVVELETLFPTAVEDMIHGDDWDLTLFTCTVGGRTRVAVRCERTEAS